MAEDYLVRPNKIIKNRKLRAIQNFVQSRLENVYIHVNRLPNFQCVECYHIQRMFLFRQPSQLFVHVLSQYSHETIYCWPYLLLPFYRQGGRKRSPMFATGPVGLGMESCGFSSRKIQPSQVHV